MNIQLPNNISEHITIYTTILSKLSAVSQALMAAINDLQQQ
jgi:hypothetical protein